MDRGVRAIVSHRLPNAEELEAGCGDWLECCQAYIHAEDCPVSFRAWRVVEQIFDHPCAACATSRCALCEPQQRAHKLIVSAINRAAPPSTKPSARVAAEEIAHEMNGGDRAHLTYPKPWRDLFDDPSIANEAAFASWVESILLKHNAQPVVQEVYVSTHPVTLVCNQCGNTEIQSFKCPVDGCGGQLVVPAQTAERPDCAHCNNPIVQVDGHWHHSWTGLRTCRSSKSNQHDGIYRAEPATAAATADNGGQPWCESCRSYHPTPRDVAHKAALGCRGTWYFADSVGEEGK